jgi:hypothetical protein
MSNTTFEDLPTNETFCKLAQDDSPSEHETIPYGVLVLKP